MFRAFTRDAIETATALRAARLAKADLATQMVVEMTSLQGVMGAEYALRSGETPEVAQAIREQFPAVRLLANTMNAYFSAANNQGIAAAQGRYVLALNPDTLVQGSTLAQLVAQMDARPQIGAATTRILCSTPSSKPRWIIR